MIGLRALAKALKPLERRLAQAVLRAVVDAVDDERRLQLVQVSALHGEVQDGVERWQQYGFTSHPHPEAEAVLLAVGGQRSHAVAIAVDDRRYRLVGLERGEVAVYDDQGQYLVLRRDRIDVFGKKLTVAIEGDADVTVGGNLTAQATSVEVSALLDATVQAAGAVQVRAGGAATVEAAGSAKVQAGLDVEVKAGGAAKVEAIALVEILSAFGITISAPNITLQALAAIAINAPQVLIQGLTNYSAHKHGGVTSGSAQTGTPT